MIQAITNVFSGLGEWIVDFLPTVQSIFWDSTANTLTLMGVLAVCGLAVSIFFLLMGIIQNFLHFRG